MKTKKSILLLTVMSFFGLANLNAQNQKIAYVDSDYILENIPEYGDAQEEINSMSEKWEKEIKELMIGVWLQIVDIQPLILTIVIQLN